MAVSRAHPALPRGVTVFTHPCCILTALRAQMHCSSLRVQPPGAASVAAIWFSADYGRYICWKIYVQDARSAGSRSWNRALILANVKPRGGFQVTVSSDTPVSSC